MECAADRRDPTTRPIGEPAMRAGEVLALWFVGEAERVYAMLAEKPEDRSARLLAEWVGRKGGRATPRDLQRSNRKYGTAGEAEAALDALAAAGFGWWDDPHPATGGRPAGRAFVLDRSPPADGRHKPTEGGESDAPVTDPGADERPTPAPATPKPAEGNGASSASVGRRPGPFTPESPPDPAPAVLAVSSAASLPSPPPATGVLTNPAPPPPPPRVWTRVRNDDRPPELRG